MALESTKAALSGLALSSPSEIHHADNEQHVPVGTMNCEEQDDVCGPSNKKASVDIDVKEVYFLIMHFLSDGPCRKACAQLREELEEYKLLPRRYHAWYSREGTCSGNKEDDGVSVPLSYSELLQRYGASGS
jgi:PH-interacting protein